MSHLARTLPRPLLGCIAVWLLGVSTAKAEMIANGSFESGLTGWTVFSIPINTNIHVETAYGPGFDGAAWLFLGGFDTQGYVEQTVTGLTKGTTYALNFLMASELARSDTLVVSMTDGSSTPSLQFFAPPGFHWNDWVPREYDFLASGTSATFRFSSVASLVGVPFDEQPHYDVGLDNVSIASVPESSTLVYLATIALVFAVTRRRKLGEWVSGF